jgi:hypothetical protein
MTYSLKKDDETLNEMIEYYGIENIPNPEHYPMRFDFIVKSFVHYKKMQEIRETKIQ